MKIYVVIGFCHGVELTPGKTALAEIVMTEPLRKRVVIVVTFPIDSSKRESVSNSVVLAGNGANQEKHERHQEHGLSDDDDVYSPL